MYSIFMVLLTEQHINFDSPVKRVKKKTKFLSAFILETAMPTIHTNIHNIVHSRNIAYQRSNMMHNIDLLLLLLPCLHSHTQVKWRDSYLLPFFLEFCARLPLPPRWSFFPVFWPFCLLAEAFCDRWSFFMRGSTTLNRPLTPWGLWTLFPMPFLATTYVVSGFFWPSSPAFL